MTPVFFSGGVHHFYISKMLTVPDKYLIQSKYINKTETKQKQRPSFVTVYNITRGLVNTVHQSLINWRCGEVILVFWDALQWPLLLWRGGGYRET